MGEDDSCSISILWGEATFQSFSDVLVSFLLFVSFFPRLCLRLGSSPSIHLHSRVLAYPNLCLGRRYHSLIVLLRQVASRRVLLRSFWFPLKNQTASSLSETDITGPTTTRTDRLSHDPSFSPSLFHLDIGTLPGHSNRFSGRGLFV